MPTQLMTPSPTSYTPMQHEESPNDTIHCPKCGAVFKESQGQEQPANPPVKKKGFGSMLSETGEATKKEKK